MKREKEKMMIEEKTKGVEEEGLWPKGEKSEPRTVGWEDHEQIGERGEEGEERLTESRG
jgi:hypothetical protein